MPRTASGGGNNINAQPVTERVFQGRSADGQLSLVNNGQGWKYRRHKTNQLTNLGPAPTMAMACTELCAEARVGMVCYLTKASRAQWHVDGKITLATVKLPSLIYVHHLWSDKDKEDWFKFTHRERMMLLAARANAISEKELVMPIMFFYENIDYSSFKLIQGIVPITMSYSNDGWLYLGYISDLIAINRSCIVRQPSPADTFWTVEKSNATAFHMASGPQLAETLKSLYLADKPGANWFFKDVMLKVIAAHHEWVANGGFTFEDDKTLGAKVRDNVQDQIRNLRKNGTLFPSDQDSSSSDDDTSDIGRRYQELLSQTLRWTSREQQTLQDYIDMALSPSVATLVNFVRKDRDWLALDEEKQDIIIEYRELELQLERENRTGAFANEADESDDDHTSEAESLPESRNLDLEG